MNNPVFILLNEQLGLKEALKFQLKPANDNKNFFLSMVKLEQNTVAINSCEFQLNKPHISVYEEQAVDESEKKLHLSCYHFTVTLISTDPNEQLHARVYFDRSGHYLGAIVKDKSDQVIKITDSEQQHLKLLAMQVTNTFHMKIIQVLKDSAEKLQNEISAVDNKAAEILNEKPKGTAKQVKQLERYKLSIEELIGLNQQLKQVSVSSSVNILCFMLSLIHI